MDEGPDDDTTRPGRPGPKRARGEPSGPAEVRAAVIETAGRLFGEYGVEATTLRQIAAGANVQPGLIIRYVGRRDKLIETVYEHITAQLLHDIEHGPLRPHSFERDSVMGRWTVMFAYYALRREQVPTQVPNPVTAIARVIEEHYGATPDVARWRAAQIIGSAVGWRLFEPLLMEMGGIDRENLEAIRLDLNLLHNITGSLPLPTTDPRPPEQR